MPELIGRTKGQPASAAAQASRDTRETTITPDPRPDDAVVRRTKDGWRVGSADLPHLTSAMVLADLISAELSAPPEAAAGPPTGAGAGESPAQTPRESAAAKDKARSKVKAQGRGRQSRTAGNRHRHRCRRQRAQPAAATARRAVQATRGRPPKPPDHGCPGQ